MTIDEALRATVLDPDRGVPAVLARAASPRHAAEDLARALCEHLDLEAGAFYETVPPADRLRVVAAWPDLAHADPALRAAVAGAEVAPGQGVIGQAWASGRPCAGDADVEPARGQAAGSMRYRALVVPVRVGGAVTGVFALWARRPSLPEPDLLAVAAALAGVMFGQCLERMRADEERHHNRERLRVLAESLPVPLIMQDVQGRATLWSRAAERLLGWSAEEASAIPGLGREIDTPEWAAARPSMRDRVFRDRENLRGVNARLRHKDGREVDVLIAASPLVTRSGEVTEVVAVLEDVTERLRFLEVAAHELRNPLSSVVAILDVAERYLVEGEDAEQVLPLIRGAGEEIDRLNALLHDVLEAFRVSGGRLHFREAAVDLRGVVAAAVQPFQLAGGACRFRLADDAAGPLPVLGDARRLEDLLRNLLSNARKYSPAGGDVWVRLRAEGGRAHLSVSDQGIGVPEAQLHAIFAPFARGVEGGRPDPGGVGLGLYISASIAQRHGGRVWAENNPEGGATFHVELPLLGGAPGDEASRQPDGGEGAAAGSTPPPLDGEGK